jgi:hypothetical protein
MKSNIRHHLVTRQWLDYTKIWRRFNYSDKWFTQVVTKKVLVTPADHV